MSEGFKTKERQMLDREFEPRSRAGMPVLLVNIVLIIATLILFIRGSDPDGDRYGLRGDHDCGRCPLLFYHRSDPFAGLKVLKRNEALVLTLFGRYYGTLKGEGFFFVNPFAVAFNPASQATSSGIIAVKPTVPTAAKKHPPRQPACRYQAK